MDFVASILRLSLIVTVSVVFAANGQSQVAGEDSVFPPGEELTAAERQKLLASLNPTLKAAGLQPAAVKFESGQMVFGIGITFAVVLDEPRPDRGRLCRGPARLYAPDNDASGKPIWTDQTAAARRKGELQYVVLSRTPESCRGPFDPDDVTLVVGTPTDADIDGAVGAIRNGRVNRFFAMNRYNRVAQDNAISSIRFFIHEGQPVAKAITIGKTGKKQLLYLSLEGNAWVVDGTDALRDGY